MADKSGYLDATKNTTKYKALLSLISALFIVLIVAFIIYESKKTVLMLPYYIGLYDFGSDFGNEALPELTVITGISSNHYNESLDMFGSVHYHLPNTSIVVYDLGLKRHQIKTLRKLRNAQVVAYNFSRYPHYGPSIKYLRCYHWKINVINEFSNSHEDRLFLWLDASVRIVGPLNNCIKKLKSFPLVAGQSHLTGYNMVAFTKNSTVQYLNMTRESLRGMAGFQSGILLFNNSHPAAQFLLEKWVDCAMHYECICGLASLPRHCKWYQYEKGGIAYNGCHRFDQATLNVLVAKYYSQYRNSITSWECSKSFLVKRWPTMDWRKYIAEDLH